MRDFSLMSNRKTAKVDEPFFHGRTLKALTILLGLGYGFGIVEQCHAMPLDGQVVSGAATLVQSKNTLNVEQSSGRALIDWQSFGIGSGEKVNFKQPTADSITVNRVLGYDFSSISGSLTANGRVVLVNPHGVIFQDGAQVDVGGLTATTRWITKDDFDAGRLSFNALDGADGMVINRGVIALAPGGAVVLAASHVENTGVIKANLGRVALGAGDAFTLNFDGDRLLSFAAPASSRVGKALEVINKGTIQANGGSVLLTTNAAEAVVNSVVSIGGRVEAHAVDFQDGRIILHAGSGAATVSGTLDASGSTKGQKGGNIQVLGNQVQLTESAHLDASGNAGGGTILIGGDQHGDNPDIQNARQTMVDKGATIAANATHNGDGGRVVVWSDEKSGFYGKISARGGENSGNGGFVETSSKKLLEFNGQVDAVAPRGRPGTLLLDPSDITVVTAGANSTTANVDQFADADGAGGSKIAPATLSGANANIQLQATNDIIFNDPISLNPGFSLTVQAGRHISVNNSITTSNAAIHLEADSPHSSVGAANGIGTLTIAATGSLSTSGGNVTLIGADFSILGAINAGAGNVTIASSRSGAAGDITIGSGIVSLAELQKITSTGTVSIGKATTKGTDGAGTGAVTLQGSSITVDATSLDLSGQNFALKLDPSSAINLGSLTIATNAGLTFNASTTMTGALTVNTHGGDITFNNSLDGTQSVTLTAGGGNVTFADHVGSTIRLGDLTIKSANNVTAADIKSAFLTQENGSGATTINGVVDASLAVSITANNGITLGSAVTMKGDLTLITTGGNISLNTLDGNQNVTLTAGTGNVTMTGNVGSTTPVGNLTINSAHNVTAAGVRAASLRQTTGSGTTTFNGVVDSSGAVNLAADGGITFGAAMSMNGPSVLVTAGTAINFNGTVNGSQSLTLTAGGGNVTFAADAGGTARLGDLTIISAQNVTTAGIKAATVTQNAGTGTTTFNGIVDADSTVSITTNNDVTFGSPMTMKGPLSVKTSGGGGNINFNSTLDGAQNFTLTAGTGNIHFVGAVGSITPPVTGTIVSAKDVTVDSTLRMSSLTQSAGTGTTLFSDAITLTTGGLNLTGKNFTFNGTVNTLTAAQGGTVTIANSGLLTINKNMSLDGTFTQNGSGLVALGGNITTTNDPISIARDVTLTGNIFLSTGGNGPGNINFAGTIDGGDVNSLTLFSGDGTVTLGGRIGGTTKLSALTINGTTGTGVISLGDIGGASAGVTGSTTVGNAKTTEITLTGSSYKTTDAQTYAGPVALGNNVTMDTTGAVAGVGVVTFTATINSKASENRSLTIASGDSATTIQGVIGNTTRLSALTINGTGGNGMITLNSIGGALPGITGAMVLGNDTTTGIALKGTTYKTSGSQQYMGAITLGADTLFDTFAAPAGTGTVKFNSTIKSDGSTGRSLSVVSNDSPVTFAGDIGGETNGIYRFNIDNGRGDVTLHNVRLVYSGTNKPQLNIHNNSAPGSKIIIGSTINLSAVNNSGGTVDFGQSDIVPENPGSTLEINTSGSIGGDVKLGKVTRNSSGAYFDGFTVNMNGADSKSSGTLTINQGAISVDGDSGTRVQIVGNILATKDLVIETNPASSNTLNSGTIDLSKAGFNGNSSTVTLRTSGADDKDVAHSHVAGSVLLGVVGSANQPLGPVRSSTEMHSALTVDVRGATSGTAISGTLTLYGDVWLNNDLDFTRADKVVLSAPEIKDSLPEITIDTYDNTIAGGSAGRVRFSPSGSIDGSRSLRINAWADAANTGGNVDLPSIGKTTPLTGLTVDGGTVTLNGNISTDKGHVTFHQRSGDSAVIKMGEHFYLPESKSEPEISTAPVFRIVTHGGNISFQKLIAQNDKPSAMDKNYLNVELLAGESGTTRQTKRDGGTITGDLDVWNATLTGSGGALTGQIHRAFGEFKYPNLRGWAAAQTIFASPTLGKSYIFTFNGIPVPGYGKPQGPTNGYDNLTRGSVDNIPNRTSNKDWMLDSSKNPALYSDMVKWKDEYEQKQLRVVKEFKTERVNYKKYLDSFMKAMKKNNNHAIVVGVGTGISKEENGGFYLEPLRKGPEYNACIVGKALSNIGYHVLRLITHESKDGADTCLDKNEKHFNLPTWQNFLEAVKAFSEASSKSGKVQKLIIYFSGHGILHEGHGYLVAYDAGIKTMQNVVSLEQIKKVLELPFENKTEGRPSVMLMHDSCYPADMSLVDKTECKEKFDPASEVLDSSGAFMSITTTYPFVGISKKKKEFKPSVSLSSLIETKDMNNNELVKGAEESTSTFFSELFVKALTKQAENSGPVGVSRIYELIREGFNGKIEIESVDEKQNLSLQFFEFEPKFGFVSKDKDVCTERKRANFFMTPR
ncbi:MAG: filamentous hemagglutinin N-terminal domain-containing protein [Magnetococcales bacterium]|nr:filamentous hemagglutinin N-terminal domain-containing protein [Magnetococcales bacterium]